VKNRLLLRGKVRDFLRGRVFNLRFFLRNQQGDGGNLLGLDLFQQLRFLISGRVDHGDNAGDLITFFMAFPAESQKNTFTDLDILKALGF